ncbi:MAG: DUF1631 domain-containing protein [Halopseudomonas sp.]|uniref:DUF1631 domain-containing protein n=1 Tax=Halopseudomonas sp. TaxID=2901191 RepID=UPI0030015027
MSQDPKVVSIKPNLAARGKPVTSAAASLLPVPLVGVRDHLQGYLDTAFNSLFDNADDNLFEMADRASSNAEQTLFFEAMRTVRLQRGAMLKSISQSLLQATERLNGDNPVPVASAHVAFELDSLTLVQPDELEQSVALDGMISRVNSRNQQALMHLAIRCNSLVKGLVDERTNPLAPAALADYFAEALKPLALEIKVRLIVLKLFERYVFNGIDAEYEALNKLLIDAGVMPDLRLAQVTAAPRRAPAAGTGSGSADSSRGTPASAADQQEVLSMFSELIGNWRHASGDMALSGLTGGGGRPLRSNELLQVLAELPMDEASDTAAGDRLPGMRQRIQHALRQQSHQGEGEQKMLGRVDDDVISLVSMLFDFILEDPALPAAVKAMIGRLQLPILRVAIADKSFFSRGSHPARRLLNELARATMGWNDQDDLRRDQLHALLQDIVERLLAVSEPQDALFETLYAELTDFLRNEQRRSDRIEQRTRDAEEGRARMQAARNDVARAINSLLAGRTLPVTLVDLLRDGWSQVLQMVCLREGSESAAWTQTMLTAQQMIESVEPVTPEHRAKRESSNDAVRDALRAGLETLGLDASAVAAQVALLAKPQLAVLMVAQKQAAAQRLLDEQHAARAEQASAQQRVHIPAVEASVESAPLPIERAAAEPPAPVPEDTVPADAGQADAQPTAAESAAEPLATQNAAPGVEPIEQVHIQAPVLEVAESEPVVETVEDLPSVGALRWIEGLRAGCWFQLGATEGQPEQRCKLAAIISFSGKYIFVNRGGMKVAEFGKTELAQRFEQGLITLLDENQLFDRALESVIGNLRRLQAGKP